MKNFVCIIIFFLCCANNTTLYSQGEEVVIDVKNTSGKSVGIYAGPKEGIRDPHVQSFGGLSTNKVYVKLNDVICLMNPDKTPKACMIVKPGVTMAEVTEAANSIVAK
jgi:hypothetical protein